MKKLNYLLIPVLFCLTVGLTGCGEKTETASETEIVTEEQPAEESPMTDESSSVDTSTPDGAWTVLTEFDRQKYAAAEQLTAELANFPDAVKPKSLDSLKTLIGKIRTALPDRKTMSRDDITNYDKMQDAAIEMINRFTASAPTCENCKTLSSEVIRLDNQSINIRSVYDKAVQEANEDVQIFTIMD